MTSKFGDFAITPRTGIQADSGDPIDYQYGQPSARHTQPLEALDHAPQPDMRAIMGGAASGLAPMPRGGGLGSMGGGISGVGVPSILVPTGKHGGRVGNAGRMPLRG